MASKEGNVKSDVESGEDALGRGNSFSTCSEGKRILTRSCSALTKFDGLRGQGGEESTRFMPKSGHPSCGNVVINIDRNSGVEYRDLLDFPGRGYLKEKLSKPYSNKHSKPPRPPKGPSLNAYDMRFVKEILDLASKKRARIERMRARALKKKAVKSSSSTSSIIAMVVTVLFFIVIILQGLMGSRVMP